MTCEKFIPIAERCGYIVPIGRWVLREACRQTQSWLDADLAPTPMAINISAVVMTQELIANMLGVRREGVSEAALKLQQAGLIRYARGHISVLDRDGL